MKVLKYFLFLFVFIAGLSNAAMRTPKDDRGFTLPTVDLVGAVPCNIDSSTGTNLTLCSSVRGVVYGVVASSLALTNYITMFNSSVTTQGASSLVSTITAVYNFSTAWSTATATTHSNMIIFPVPIRFTTGIVARSAVTPDGPVGNSRWTILYRPLDSTGE